MREPRGRPTTGARRVLALALLFVLGGIAWIDLRVDPSPGSAPEILGRELSKSAPDVMAPELGSSRESVSAATQLTRVTDSPVGPDPDPPGSIAIQVTLLPNRTPAAGAIVDVSHSGTDPAEPRQPSEALRADEHGQLSIARAEGKLTVAAWLGNHAGGPLTLDVLSGTSQQIEILLDRAGSVEGYVLSASTEAPVEGAEIWVETFARSLHCRSDAQGKFRFAPYPSDGAGYEMRCRAPGFGEDRRFLAIRPDGGWTLWQGVRGASSRTWPVDAEGHSQPARVSFRMSPQLVVSGRVLAANGDPVASARVAAQGYFWLSGGMATPDAATVETDALGRFRVVGLRSDVSHSLTVFANGHAEATVEIPATSEPEVDLGSIGLVPEAVLVGSVLLADGSPASGVEIVLAQGNRPSDQAARPTLAAFPRDAVVPATRRSTRTDASGWFQFGGLGAGTYEFVARLDGGRLDAFRADIAQGELRHAVALTLPERVRTLRGVVLVEDRPAREGQIELEREGNRRRAAVVDGAFSILVLDDGKPYRLHARGRDASGLRREQILEVQGGAGSVTVRIHGD